MASGFWFLLLVTRISDFAGIPIIWFRFSPDFRTGRGVAWMGWDEAELVESARLLMNTLINII